jgi:hypothetical protein
MKDIIYINEQLDKIIEFKPNVEYSDDYRCPKDRIIDFVSICKNEEEIWDVLNLVQGKIDAQLKIYAEGDLFGVGISYYEPYRAFNIDLMTEIDTIFNLYNFYSAPIDEDVTEEDVPDLNTLQNRTKIVLLQELGVLDFLKKKEPFKNSTNLAKLIAELISGKNDDVNSVCNSIRTDLSYVTQKKNPKSPYTKPQIQIVNSKLASFSLPIIK